MNCSNCGSGLALHLERESGLCSPCHADRLDQEVDAMKQELTALREEKKDLYRTIAEYHDEATALRAKLAEYEADDKDTCELRLIAAKSSQKAFIALRDEKDALRAKLAAVVEAGKDFEKASLEAKDFGVEWWYAYRDAFRATLSAVEDAAVVVACEVRRYESPTGGPGHIELVSGDDEIPLMDIHHWHRPQLFDQLCGTSADGRKATVVILLEKEGEI